MAFNPIGFLGEGIKIIGGVLNNDTISNIGKGLTGENNDIPPEKKAQLQTLLYDHVEKMRSLGIEEMKVKMDELRLAISEDIEMIKSPDKYVSRARPTSLYAAVVLTSFMVVVVGILMLNKISIDWSGVASVSSLILPLWGHAAWYSKLRTDEKLAQGKKQDDA